MAVNSPGIFCIRPEGEMGQVGMLAHLDMGLPADFSSPTGDGMFDPKIENMEYYNDQGPPLGIGLCPKSPTGL